MRRIFSILLVSLFISSAAYAQVEIVQAVKNDLVARQVSLSGPCGAFEITKRVAWILRGQGVGLLEKTAGNNCQGYSVDYLVFPDMSGRDILGDGGGENAPAWNAEPNEPAGTFAGRWRAAFDPGGTITPIPNPGTPPPTPSNPDETLTRITRVEATTNEILKQLAEHEAKEAAFRQAVADEYKSNIAPVFKFVGKFVLPAAIAFFGGRALIQ